MGVQSGILTRSSKDFPLAGVAVGVQWPAGTDERSGFGFFGIDAFGQIPPRIPVRIFAILEVGRGRGSGRGARIKVEVEAGWWWGGFFCFYFF